MAATSNERPPLGVEIEDSKNAIELSENIEAQAKASDPALKAIGDERIEVTQEDVSTCGDGQEWHILMLQNDRIRKRTDKFILSILMLIYFLQALDKTSRYCIAVTSCLADLPDFGYANVLGVSEDLGLEGNQYSLLNIILSSAQLAWQPISSYILVRVPPRILMTVLVVCWGSIQTGMAGGTT
jgi:hypothetical protein